MLIGEARVETERSSRYLVQLCEHVSKVAQGPSQMDARVEWSEDRGSIEFGWGRCTLRAEPDVLNLRAGSKRGDVAADRRYGRGASRAVRQARSAEGELDDAERRGGGVRGDRHRPSTGKEGTWVTRLALPPLSLPLDRDGSRSRW